MRPTAAEPCLDCALNLGLERLAEKGRLFQPIPPRDFRGLGDPDARAGRDLHLLCASGDLKGSAIKAKSVVRTSDPKRFA
jgi:hypothetical protein